MTTPRLQLPRAGNGSVQRYVPLHHGIVDAVTPLLDGRNRKDDTLAFAHEYFDRWASGKKFL